MKIVIPGGSGQVGHILARHFHENGHAVTVLSRNPRTAPWRVVVWDGVTPGEWIADVETRRRMYQSSGRSVNCRYTAANRREIYDSRIRSTQLVESDVIGSLKRAPRLWVNASTATIYRHALDRAMDETDGELGGNEPGAPDTWNFSIGVAKAWEEAFFSTANAVDAQSGDPQRDHFKSRSRRSFRRAPGPGTARAAEARKGRGTSLFRGYMKRTSCARWIC